MQVTPESCVLHYISTRPGLMHLAIGLVKGAAELLFGQQVEAEVLQSREEDGVDHDVSHEKGEGRAGEGSFKA